MNPEENPEEIYFYILLANVLYIKVYLPLTSSYTQKTQREIWSKVV